jgi:uncharacterized membrane protein YbhN (UPF0104 family)
MGLRFPVWLRIMVAAMVLAALVAWAGPTRVLARFAEISPVIAIFGLAGALLSQWVGAIRLAFVARSRGLSLTATEALSINLSAIFYGLFLPGGSSTGWAVRLIRLARSRIDVGAAVLALGTDRVCATLSLAAIGLVIHPLLGSPASRSVLLLLTTITFVTAILYLLLFGMLPHSLLARLRFSRIRGWFRRLGMDQELPARGAQVGSAAKALLLSFCMHVIGIGIWFALARSLDIDLDFLTIAWVRSAAMVVALLPVSVSGLGLRESAAIYLLRPYGVAPADALSLSLAVFAITMLLVGLVGGLAELWRFLAHRDETNRVR